MVITKTKTSYAKLKTFILDNANTIQKIATQHHKKFLADKVFRTEFIPYYQEKHVEIVREIAYHLDADIKKTVPLFKSIGETLAEKSVEDQLNIDEAVDGIIFLKQATWDIVESGELLESLSVREFFEISRVIGTYIDVIASKIAFSYHRQTEEKLKLSEQRFQTLIEKSTDVIALSTSEGRYTFVTSSIQPTLGYTPAEFIQIKGQDIIHPDDVPLVMDKFKDLLTQHGISSTIELRGKHKNNTWRWIEVTATNLLHEPTINAIVSNFRDITDRKKLEKQKDEFIGVATHELKTPVTSLKGYAQVLQQRFKKAGDETSAGYLAKMDAQINKLTNLIGDLLDVTKIDAGKLRFHFQDFCFHDLVVETIESMQLTTDKHHIILEGENQKMVRGDANRVSQVISNLISNAIKYSPTADKILVQISEQDSSVMLCVQDFGIGISDKNKQKVFERFFRETGSAESTFPGLGLGLYISKEIVERHGGTIWVERTDGAGSIFCFRLPTKGRHEK